MDPWQAQGYDPWASAAGDIQLVDRMARRDSLLDEEDVRLKAGDVVVQRGTNHAWANRTNDPCLVMFVQCGAIRVLV